jgi:two-component system clock-associated histidine kinase SasA
MPVIYEAVDAVQPNADGKKQNIVTEIDKELPRLWVDQDMITRVLINLLDNAVKYTPNEGKIVLAAGRKGDTVDFMVEDSGPGIPDEERDTVFNKFYRLRSEHKKTGFGLGLAFCKLAVEAHGGRIWVDNPQGEGSCFRFSLPIGPLPSVNEA